jgi:hypothetical protein
MLAIDHFRREALGELYDDVRAARVGMTFEGTERSLGSDVYVTVFFVERQDTGFVQPGKAQVGICGQQVREDLGKEILEPPRYCLGSEAA